ncbi:SH2 domain-containing protein [Ditylenchus destructor]|nr:SH2 domain-containing protein [Ditylenchus destructor]
MSTSASASASSLSISVENGINQIDQLQPTSSNSPSSSSCSLSLQSCSLSANGNNGCACGLLKMCWYWPNTDKETVSLAMENKPDGTFTVRDATTKGDFTLTLRIGGVNKLIKVFVVDGRCGFTKDTLDFYSVVELVEFYRINSLKEFNEKLDTSLMYPLANSNAESEEKSSKSPEPSDYNSKTSLQVVRTRLEGLHAEYERVSRRYDSIFLQKASLLDESKRKRMTLSGYDSALGIYHQKSNLLKELMDEAKELVTTNVGIQQSRVDDIIKAQNLLGVALKNIDQTIKQIDVELEQLKPRLLSLHRKRDDAKESLMYRHKLTHANVERMMQDVTFVLDYEPPNLTGFLLQVPMNWDPSGWLTTQCKSKEEINKLINLALTKASPDKRDGVFIIRPTLVDFVRYYSRISLKEHNSQLDTCLTFPAMVLAMM